MRGLFAPSIHRGVTACAFARLPSLTCPLPFSRLLLGMPPYAAPSLVGAPGIESTVAPSVSHHWFAGLFDTAKQRDRSAGGSQRMKIALIGSVGDFSASR